MPAVSLAMCFFSLKPSSMNGISNTKIIFQFGSVVLEISAFKQSNKIFSFIILVHIISIRYLVKTFFTIVDIDFENAAGFQGVKADTTEGQYVVHFLSHAMMFCMGTLLEAHIVLTPAICVFGERFKFSVYGGTHNFIKYSGIDRVAHHVCIHKGYNHSNRWNDCANANLALLVLDKQFVFHEVEYGADFAINRLRYGMLPKDERRHNAKHCHYFGWGSRRNGYLIPLLIHLRKVDVVLLPTERCYAMWNYKEQYLCVQQKPCKTEKFGALCPDDLGSVIECSGHAVGMMISRLVDRPCGVGFLDLTKHNKFLTCGIDDARDVLTQDWLMSFDYTPSPVETPSIITVPPTNTDVSTDDLDI